MAMFRIEILLESFYTILDRLKPQFDPYLVT